MVNNIKTKIDKEQITTKTKVNDMSSIYIIKEQIKQMKRYTHQTDVGILLFKINEYVQLLKENKISYLEECERLLSFVKPHLKDKCSDNRHKAQEILWQLYKINPNIIKKGITLNLFLIKDSRNINTCDALKFLTEIGLKHQSLKSLVIKKLKDCLNYYESENIFYIINDMQNSLTLLQR